MKPLNERGAIMIIAVFFAIFGVAILYYMIGMGQAVLFRERMQDAADATALSAAIANARGMNFIVLINIVMAALLAILVTIKLVEGIAIIGMFIAGAMAWVTFGGSLAAIPPLRAIQQSMDGLYETTKEPVYSALYILNSTAYGVQLATPPAADVAASENISEHWGSSITMGVAVGSREGSGLPVQDDTFKSLCGRAGQLPIQIAEVYLKFPASNLIFGKLETAMNKISRALSDWFCGDTSSAPTYDETESDGYPKLENDDKCQNSKRDQAAPHANATTNKDCAAQQQEQVDAEPDKDTGNCQAGHDCSLSGAYNRRVVQARVQCDPTQSPPPSDYTYQYRTGRVYYTWVKGQWIRQKPQYDPYAYGDSAAAPCGPAEVNPAIAVGYNTVVRRNQDINEVLPVCSDEKVPPVPPFPRDNEESDPVDFTEVTQILGCTKSVTKSVDFNLDANGKADKPMDSNQGDDKAPKKLEDGATLGDENFQLRSLIIGKFPSDIADPIVKLSLWKQNQPGNPLGPLEALGRISFAQAEYYYEGTASSEEYMWNMKWRARLVRFRIPGQVQLGALKTAAPAVLPEVVDKLTDISNLTVH